MVGNSYRQNQTFRQAGFLVLQARAQQGIVGGGLFPQTQQLAGDYTRTATSREDANRGTTGANRFFGQWDLGFNLAWELDFWGRFRRAVEAADARLDASAENYDEVLATLLGDVATNYINLRAFELRIKLIAIKPLSSLTI